MFYASSHLLLFFKWVSFLLKNRVSRSWRRELKHSSALIEVCNSWTHSGQINSSLVHSLEHLVGLTIEPLQVSLLSCVILCLSSLLHLALSFDHCPWMVGQDSHNRVGFQCDSSSAELPWVVWEQTDIVQLLYPH